MKLMTEMIKPTQDIKPLINFGSVRRSNNRTIFLLSLISVKIKMDYINHLKTMLDPISVLLLSKSQGSSK